MPKRFTAIAGGGLELSTTKIQNFNLIYLRDYAAIKQYIPPFKNIYISCRSDNLFFLQVQSTCDISALKSKTFKPKCGYNSKTPTASRK